MLLLAVCALAWTIGRDDERRFVVVLIAASIATLAAQTTVPWARGLAVFLLIDGIVLAFAVRLALVSRRYWPIWFSAFQLVGVVTATATLARPGTLPHLYGQLASFWALPALLAMAIGLTLDRRAGL